MKNLKRLTKENFRRDWVGVIDTLKALHGKRKFTDWRYNRTTCNPTFCLYNGNREYLIVVVHSGLAATGDHNLDDNTVDKVGRLHNLLINAKTITKKIIKQAESILRSVERSQS